MKNFKLFLVFMLLMTGLIPVFGSSSAHFYAKLTTNSATGAGEIYVYRGGGDNLSPYDKLNMPSGGWQTLNSTSESFDAGVIEMSSSNHPDGYSYIDKSSSSGTNTKGALHMYFFARPFAGYQFDGWYGAAAGTGNSLKGSVYHYPFPGKQYVGAPVAAPGEPSDGSTKDYYGNFNGSNYHAKSGSAYKNWMSRWNNGTAGATPPGAGIWDGVHYLRHVEVINNGDNKDITKYAKFSIIPRHFVFVGTGFDDVSYTAGGTNVGASTIESGNITSNIALSITYDANKYNFVKWQYSEGFNGVKHDISTSPTSATYTFVANRGYPEAHYPDWEHPNDPITYDENYTKVYIWPILQEKLDAEATVQIGEADPVPYEHWANAFSAATADNVSGAIITLKKNITGITTVQAVDRNMTLNLNGFTITGSVNNMFTVSGSGTNFTLCDNTPAQAGRIVHNPADPGTTTYAIKVSTKDTLTLTSGGVAVTGVNNVANSAGSSRGVYIQSGGALKMSGGQISSQSTNNAYALVNEGKATISGGVCTAYAKGASSAKTGLTARAFYNTGSPVTIDGGVFTASADSSTTVCGIQHNNSDTMTINYAEVNVTVGKGNGAYDLYRSAGKIMVYDGKYIGKYPSSVANKDQIEVRGGIYDSYLNLRSCTTEGYDCYELEQGSDYNAGYRFVVKGLEGNPNVCKLITLSGTTYYSSLADAFSYVQAHPNDLQSIVMTAFEYNFNTANNYTVPQQTAFVVPYGAGQTGAQTEPVDIQTWANLSKYHSLALGPGVNITVQGTFTVGGQQFGTSSSNPGPGSVVGSYAMLDMSAGGHLTIANGASLYAYGFIKGAGDQSTSGTITIQNGGTVYEDLVVNDMHGGGGTAACVNGTSGSNSYGLFPFSQYFIQNVEPRMTIEYGGVEKASYNIQSSQGGKKDMINVIGTGSDFLFQTSSGSTITKWYDATRDYQCYEVSGGMSMNGLTIDAGMASMSSSSFILPLNNNMDIHVKSGAVLDLPYALKLQAGAKLTIDEGAIVNVNNEMYVYDYQDWDKYAISYAQTFGTTTAGRKLDWHTLRDVSSAAKLGNADVIVNGQLVIKGSGALYTTSHGANITSTGSGKIIFNVAGKSANKNLYECWSTYGKKSDGTALAQGETDIADGQVKVGSFNLLKTWYIYGTPIVCNPAQLKNANGTFTSTSGAAANDVYQYCDDTWKKGGCINYYTITWKSEDGNSTLETDADVAEGSATSFDGTTPSKATTAQYTYTFDGWATEANGAKVYEINGTPDVEGDVTYYAHFSPTLRSYTLTWVTDGDALTGDYTSGTVENGASIIAPNTPTKTGYTFAGWNPDVPGTMPAAHTTYTATWAIDEDLEVKEDEKVIVSKDEEVTTTTVHTDAVLTVDDGKTLSTTTFIIEAISEVTDTPEAMNSAHSGSGEATGNVEADYVYFDLILNNPSNRRWNAFTVPFKVDLRKSGNPIQINGETLTLGRGYDIVYYNGATRAAQGPVPACWEYVEDHDSILYPGRAYMIASASRAIQTVRFTKAADAPILYDGKVAVAANTTEIATGNNGGWNGIGNPMMYHAVMNAGVTLCQVHDGGEIGKDGYHTYDMDGRKLVVGKAVFVQVGSDNNDVPVVQATTQETIKPQAAPRRTREQIIEDRLDVQIAANGGVPADRLLLLAEEDKEDKYVILKDLSKAGVSPVRAQIWVDRYGEKLCMNTTALVNHKADYPLTISVPKEGEYDIFLNSQTKEGTMLYLTYDGRAIWNLTYGSYTASFEKGMNSHYGLRVVINEVATGIEDATIENGDAIRKVIIDDKVFIIRNGETYSITGQKAQ